MTHEHLTPNNGMNYPINRMPEVHDAPTGGPGDTGAPGREPQGARIPPTSEQIQTARALWDPIIQRTTDPDEREAMRVRAEMGSPPVSGGADVIHPTEITTD